MVDIVERLRNPLDPNGYCQEAANEIERLRAIILSGCDLCGRLDGEKVAAINMDDKGTNPPKP